MNRVKSAALILAVIAASYAPAAGASTEVDWVLIEIVAGAHGVRNGEISSRIEVEHHLSGPVIFGYAEHVDGGNWVILDSHNSGFGVATKNGFADQRVEPVPGAPLRALYYMDFSVGRLAPRASQAHLLFFPGASLVGPPRITQSKRSGTWSITVHKGNGSTAVAMSAARDEGTVIGTAATGRFSATRRVSRNIIGAQLTLCEECKGRWRSPDGRSMAWRATGENLVTSGSWTTYGEPGFVGRAGTWKWSFEGTTTAQGTTLHTGQPIIAAYAPIGSLGRLFGL